MKTPKDTVFICKAVSEENHSEKDPYTEELERKGFHTKTISVLDFVYKNIDVLNTKLCQPELYSGVIFTSPRCVRAAIDAVGCAENLNQSWQKLQTYTVGETTARIVCNNLGLNPEGSCAGSGAALAPIILKNKPGKPLLLPCGNLKMDTLEELLAKGGVLTECVEVYETKPHHELEATLTAALAEQSPSHIVYFSPSGIHYTHPILQRSGVDLDKIKWVTIGPTTAAALQSYGLPVHCSAAKPTPQSLADAMAAAVC